MKHFLSITIIPLLFVFFSFDVNWTKDGGLVFDTNYTQQSTSIISQYNTTHTISPDDSTYLKKFGESKFYNVWSSLLKENIDSLDQENDYTAILNTATNFYNLYKLLYPDSSKVDTLGSYIQKGESLASAIDAIRNDTSNIINQYSTYLKGATIKITGKFNGNIQYLYAKYINFNYGYYFVTFTNIPNESFDGTIILAIPETKQVSIGSQMNTNIVLLNDTENDIDGNHYQFGISVDDSYESQLNEYNDNIINLYITLPEEIIDYVKSM